MAFLGVSNAQLPKETSSCRVQGEVWGRGYNLKAVGRDFASIPAGPPEIVVLEEV